MSGDRAGRLPVVFLMGPTATGKTDAALWLAARFPVRVISVDSAMVYRGMDIGTAKPAPEVLARVPHHLVDLNAPEAAYSAADFCRDARAEIRNARAREELPLLVGGTMLYFRALREGLAALPPAQPEIRARIEAQAAAEGWPAVHARLAEVDPVTAARLAPNDRQRLERALEVYECSGIPLSDWHRQPRVDGLAETPLQIGLVPDDRSWLYERIGQRFRAMLDAGLAAEVQRLHARPGLHADLPSMRCVGYRQLWAWAAGASDLETATAAAITATRRLAKRQLTWLRNWPGLERLTLRATDPPTVAAERVAARIQAGTKTLV